MTGVDRYQVLPELSPEQFEALKQDIARRGVVVPVIVDEFGQVLEGHHRVRACRELGINDYPVEVRAGMSETEKRVFARKINVLRRHLTREQIRSLIDDQLKDTLKIRSGRTGTDRTCPRRHSGLADATDAARLGRGGAPGGDRLGSLGTAEGMRSSGSAQSAQG